MNKKKHDIQFGKIYVRLEDNFHFVAIRETKHATIEILDMEGGVTGYILVAGFTKYFRLAE